MVKGILTSDPSGLKDVVCSSVLTLEFDKHLKKAGGHIGRNVNIKIKI